jgi:TIR domain
MGYLTDYKNDIFLSYRRVSNVGPDRWVDAFCENLLAELQDRVGDVEIWRDTDDLRGGDAWRAKIAEALASTGIFLALINRTYFASDECRKELDRFLGQLKSSEAGGGRKLMPIFKHPARDPSELPPEVQELGRHEFFVMDDAQTFRELDPKRDADLYWERMVRMATDISVTLEGLQSRQKQRSLGKVFLARVAPELHQERERLRGALRQRGLQVVPENEYLWNAADHEQRIVNDLSDVLLSVHLVSRNASKEAQTADKDRRQLELAHAQMARRGKPAPLIWVQRAPRTDPAQQALVDFIEKSLANEGVEVLQDTLQELEGLMLEMLPQPRATPSGNSVGPAREVVLLADEADIEPLGDFRRQLGERLGRESKVFKCQGSAPLQPDKLAARLQGDVDLLIYWAGQTGEAIEELLERPELKRHAKAGRIGLCMTAPIAGDKKGFYSGKVRTFRDDDPGFDAALKTYLDSAQELEP